MNAYSAHADEPELVAFVRHMNPDRLRRLFLVHGDPPRQEALGLALTAAGYGRPLMPARGESWDV
jgi:metallo-beta-lactamase family protein